MPIARTSKQKKQNRTRKKIKRVSIRPRLSVFRSNKHIYGQIIDDKKEETLVAASDHEITKKEAAKSKTKQAFATGEKIAKKALKKDIKKVVFDKGSYAYHGRVKAFAEGAREGGLQL
jgi:large subunit ribosomal protein L18